MQAKHILSGHVRGKSLSNVLLDRMGDFLRSLAPRRAGQRGPAVDYAELTDRGLIRESQA
jgi:hypothetical protein